MGIRDERGVTLIELMVTAMLLVIALTGLAASYPLAMQAVTGGGDQTAGTLLAQQCVELAKAMPYDRLPIDLIPKRPANPAGVRNLTPTGTRAQPTPTPPPPTRASPR